MKKSLCLLAVAAMLLSGCAAAENLPKPPTFTAAPTAEPTAVPPSEVPAVQEEPAPETPAPEMPEEELPSMQPAEEEKSGNGFFVHFERSAREAYDPAEGREKILTFSWDKVQVLSDDNPEAAEKITESLAAMEDAWYTGGSVEEGYDYGYNGMLEIAEDNYGFASEYGGPMEMEADRTVSVVHADSDYCAFLITSYYFTGGVHGTYSTEAVCFDSQTGERLTLDSMSSDPEAFRLRLVEEMLKLVEEDKDGYYSERLSLTEPGNYATAFAALLREGSWYPGRDAFYVFSSLYELGPYAAGITEFAIPYENLKGILDERWIPRQTEEEARLRIDPVTDVPEGSVEIADLLVIGEGGETTLLICEGELTDLEVSTCSTGYDNRFYPDRELYYCGRIKDAAIQMALLMQGDLPDTMIRYRDGNGEHELLISLSGENGSYLLTENPGAQNS